MNEAQETSNLLLQNKHVQLMVSQFICLMERYKKVSGKCGIMIGKYILQYTKWSRDSGQLLIYRRGKFWFSFKQQLLKYNRYTCRTAGDIVGMDLARFDELEDVYLLLVDVVNNLEDIEQVDRDTLNALVSLYVDGA